MSVAVPQHRSGPSARKRLALLAAMSAVLAWSLAQAGPARPDETVIAAIMKNHPPLYALSPTGEPAGFAVDLLARAAARAGLRLDCLAKDGVAEQREALRDGEADLALVSRTDAAWERDLAQTRTVVVIPLYLFVRSDSDAVQTLDDLQGKRVGAVKGTNAAALVARRGDVGLEVLRNIQEAVLELIAGNVDAIVASRPGVERVAELAGLDGALKTVGPALAENKWTIAVRGDRPDLAERLDRALGEIIGTREYEAMYRRWFTRTSPPWTTAEVFGLAGGLFFAAILLMAAWRHASLLRVNRRLARALAKSRQAEEALRAEEERFEQVTQGAGIGLAIVGPDFSLQWANTVALGHFGEIDGRRCHQVLAGLDRPCEECSNLPILRAGKDLVMQQRRLPVRDGGRLWFQCISTPFRDKHGRVAGVIKALTPVTELKLMEEQLSAARDEAEAASRAKGELQANMADGAADRTDAAGRRLRVLVAEDNYVNRLLVAALLEEAGHVAGCVENGLDALAALTRERFDVVLMDIRMPAMDGLETTRMIRSGAVPGVDPAVPIVALTACALDDDRERFLAAGMDDFLSKPIDLARLERALEQATSGRAPAGAALPA